MARNIELLRDPSVPKVVEGEHDKRVLVGEPFLVPAESIYKLDEFVLNGHAFDGLRIISMLDSDPSGKEKLEKNLVPFVRFQYPHSVVDTKPGREVHLDAGVRCTEELRRPTVRLLRKGDGGKVDGEKWR